MPKDLTTLRDEVLERLEKRKAQRWSGAWIPKGWAELIDTLDKAIAKIDPDYKILQVKEKFGGLRFYVKDHSFNTSNEINRLIIAAEVESYHTCEICGKDEGTKPRATDTGWIRTLCNEHKLFVIWKTSTNRIVLSTY